MITPRSMAVAAILVLIVAVSAWSKLRYVDDEDFAPQRWKLDEHPAFRQQEARQTPARALAPAPSPRG